MAKKRFHFGLEQPARYQSSIKIAQRQIDLPLTMADALKILGKERCFEPEKVAQVFNYLRREPLRPLSPPRQSLVPFTAKTLRGLAIGGQWLLFYSYGLSLAELYLMFGATDNQRLSFCPCANCEPQWLNDKKKWANQRGASGYYLLHLTAKFLNLSYDSQNEKIVKQLGPDSERAPITLLTEAYFAAKLLTGQNLFDQLQWGEIYDPKRNKRVAVGNGQRGQHKANSFLIRFLAPDLTYPDIGVYTIKRPGIKNIFYA